MSSPLLLTLLVAALGIESNSDCPSTRAIRSYLAALLPAQADYSGSAFVAGRPRALVVDLRPDGLLAPLQRSVVTSDDCDERAVAAAVVIATWWPEERHAPPPAPTRQSSTTQSQGSRRLSFAAAGFASMLAGGVEPGVRAEAELTWGRLGLELALSGTASHSEDLGRGKAEWKQASAELGVTYGSARLRVDGGLIAGLLIISGLDFYENYTLTGARAGTTAGLRISPSSAAVRPWLELRGVWWPMSQQIYAVDAETNQRMTRPLPHGELQVGVGITFPVR